MQLSCQTKVLSLHHFETEGFYIRCAVGNNLVVTAQLVSPSSSWGWGCLLGYWGLSARRTCKRCAYGSWSRTWASCVLLADFVCCATWCAWGAEFGRWGWWNLVFLTYWFLGCRMGVAPFWGVDFALAHCAREVDGFLWEVLFEAWSAYGMLIFLIN